MLAYLVSIGCYNFLGVTVTHRLSAVHRTIIDALRTAVVIAVDLCVHPYAPTYGVAWKRHTWVQLVGFGVLVIGATTYHGVLRWPGLFYPPKEPPARALESICPRDPFLAPSAPFLATASSPVTGGT